MGATIRARLERRSFALDGLDKKLAAYLPKSPGFFVEAGANDGIRQSNTLFFEHYRKWVGLLVEPVPELAERCRHNRPRCAVENCALVSSEYRQPSITIQYCNLMSTVKGGMKSPTEERRHLDAGRRHLDEGEHPYEIAVPARTLSSVLDKHGVTRIDLLSLDVEGYEAEALKGIDFNRHQPRFILVEERCPTDIETVLSPRYMRVATLKEYKNHQDSLYALK